MEIRMDYCTVNFPAGMMNPQKVGEILLGNPSLMYWNQKGMSEKYLVSPHGCSWLDDSGYAPRPHRIQFSGLGCDKFYYKIPDLVSSINDDAVGISVSRIDLTFDVVIPKSDWKKFIVTAFSSSLNNDRDRKQFVVTGSGEAMTIYIGKRTSPKFFRIYNKSLENKKFQLTENSEVVDVPDDSYIIRYEVELKRKLWNRNGQKVVFDPTPYFYQYYHRDESLLEMVKSLWLSFGDDVLLPPDFANAKLDYSREFLLCSDLSESNKTNLTIEAVNSEPYSFDKTVDYILSKFGKYIPFLLTDKYKIQWFESVCKSTIGFLPEYDIDALTHYDLYDLDESCDKYENPWSDEPLDQLDFENLDWKEVDNYDSSS